MVVTHKKMEKLELKYIAPYLQYDVKVGRFDRMENFVVDKLSKKYICSNYGTQCTYDEVNPFLVQLKNFNDSEADKEIYELMGSYYSVHPDFNTPDELPYKVVQVLLKYHYDIFGLFEKGLAFDKLSAFNKIIY